MRCLNTKWLDEYLKKEDTVQVLAGALPQDLKFPSEGVQERLMEAKEKVVDVFYSTHEVTYKEWLKEQVWISSTETAHQYFLDQMFVKKDMRVICDSRTAIEFTRWLSLYIVI